MNVAAFRTKFPEFNTQQTDAFIQAYLDEASESISSELADDRYDVMHGYLTAHLLAISPHGKNARLVLPSGKTTYLERYEQIRIEVTAGLGRFV